MANRVKPGEKPPKPGEYKPVGPRGGNVDAPNVTIDGNEGHMPPTPDWTPETLNQFWAAQ